MRKVVEATRDGRRTVEVWGSGSAMREFLYVDDMADACLFLMENYSEEGHINVGTGIEVSIGDLAELLVAIINPSLTLTWDTTKPDGAPRKLLDVSRLTALGWKAQTTLGEGVARTYQWLVENGDHARGMGMDAAGLRR
jgi:GDP-L-fucose synthase